MLNTAIYFASPDYCRLQAGFLKDPRYAVLGGSYGARPVFLDILKYQPDMLLMDGGLPGMDSLQLMTVMGEMVAPPRVLYLCREPEMGEKARELGVDGVISWPDKEDALLEAALRCANRPLPGLAKRWEGVRREKAEQLMAQLGLPKNVKGRAYVSQCIQAAACSPYLLQSYSKLLYPFVSAPHHVTALAVERSIRTAIEHTWLHGNIEAMERLFGYSVDAERGKPTNAEFIALLAKHVAKATADHIEQVTPLGNGDCPNKVP